MKVSSFTLGRALLKPCQSEVEDCRRKGDDSREEEQMVRILKQADKEEERRSVWSMRSLKLFSIAERRQEVKGAKAHE